MAGVRYCITIERATTTLNQPLNAHYDRAKTCSALINLFTGIDAGNWTPGRVEIQAGQGAGSGSAAFATVVYSSSSGSQTISIQGQGGAGVGILTVASGSGTVGATIGGTLVTTTWASSDLNSCSLIAAAINANTTVNQFCTATVSGATGTITISSGSGVIKATIGGVSQSVTWGTSDTSTATALAAAINGNYLMPVVATSSAGVVTVYSRIAGTTGNAVTLAVTGTGATVSGANLANGGTNANVLITACCECVMALGITVAASGTGVTATSGANMIGANLAPATSVTFTAGATDTATVQAAIAAIRASAAMQGLVFVPTTPTYNYNTGSTLTLWANTLPTSAVLGGGLQIFVTGTGASLGTMPSNGFMGGVNATPNGFTV